MIQKFNYLFGETTILNENFDYFNPLVDVTSPDDFESELSDAKRDSISNERKCSFEKQQLKNDTLIETSCKDSVSSYRKGSVETRRFKDERFLETSYRDSISSDRKDSLEKRELINDSLLKPGYEDISSHI